jgi:hypothetical protein
VTSDPKPLLPDTGQIVDDAEARLKKELELIKERWLKKHEEDINYFEEALYNQYNLITLAGLGVLTGVGFVTAGPMGFLFASVAAAWEVSWLGIAPFSERFRRAVRASRNADALEERQGKRDSLLEQLPEAMRARHQAAQAMADEVRKQAEAAEEGELDLLEETLAKLDYLLEQYARMLLSLHGIEKNLDSDEGRELAQKVVEAEQALEGMAAGRLKTAKEKNLSVLRQRLERSRQSKDQREYLEVSLDTLENTLKLVRERVVAATTAQGISASLDEVVLELGRHREHMDEVDAQLNAAERVNFELPAEEENEDEQRRERV